MNNGVINQYIGRRFAFYNGDSCEVLKNIPDESVDLTVTSPPYDAIRTYEDVAEWDLQKAFQCFDELFRVTKPGGVCVCVISDQTINGSETGTSFRIALHAMEIGFKLHDTMIWVKDSFAFPNPNRYHQTFEYMFVFSKGQPKTTHMIADRKNKHTNRKIHGTWRQTDGSFKPRITEMKIAEYGRRFNVWEISAEHNNTTGHPAVFPIQLAADHIRSWSNENDVVLDCFMGSGTTGIAAKRLNRQFIGIEINPHYFEIAKKRISATQYVQTELFEDLEDEECEQINV